ncbi:TetR/AcrR family transcriptional regulator [Streptomyces sp. SID3343]|uniref:TetR/AcrR family transcriptional regulator n=1 Tax=Streptomyces sp. SID3343 TaxID=2690260 RepID=UPI00136C742E|nr:TetR/AcrR family transcriptional regulator [Streptomyces sp. SID3343]MYW00081.1 TetR family transcriptional regulator [Streptomyces sp. SID3343]
MTTKAGSSRMSASDRRTAVVKVALEEFAKGGLNGTATETIAARVGVSQPYLFRLFANKKALFIATAELCFDRIGNLFEQAAEGLSGADATGAMGDAYTGMLVAQPEVLLMQLQLYVASQDPEIRAVVRARWERLEELVRILTGLEPSEVTAFFARGMLCNVIAALELPAERYYSHL